MIDPKSVHELVVRCEGEAVGILSRTPAGSRFDYLESYLASDAEPIAIHLPKVREGTTASGVANLPTFFANLLPEGVMQEVITSAARLSRDDLFSQLALSVFDAVGDVTVSIPGEVRASMVRTPREAVNRLRAMIGGKVEGSFTTFSGIQPKISIGEAVASQRGTTAIVKLEPPQFPGLIANELYFNSVARAAGLEVPKMRVIEGALITERFDRVKQVDRAPRQIHVEDALQILNLYPLAKYSLDYLEVLEIVRVLGASKSVALDLIKLYVFSYLIGNGDLHAKNVSFMYDRSSRLWTLAPAYDLVCTLPYFEHDAYGRRMALGLDEQFGAFSRSDFLSLVVHFGIPESLLARSIDHMIAAIPAFLAKHTPPVSPAVVAEIQNRCRALA